MTQLSQELDYATNFLADGPGEWKDSGLGKAFRAAVANPDGINIIDWEPYGPSGLDRNLEKIDEKYEKTKISSQRCVGSIAFSHEVRVFSRLAYVWQYLLPAFSLI